jgi:hypothetical protein
MANIEGGSREYFLDDDISGLLEEGNRQFLSLIFVALRLVIWNGDDCGK